MAAATTNQVNLYATKKIDQGLTAAITRILLEDYKQSRGTTELPAHSWKAAYTKVRDHIKNHQESDLIAALTKIIEKYKDQDSINGVASMTIVKSSKNLLQLKQRMHDKIQEAAESAAEQDQNQPARIQVKKNLDNQRIDDDIVYKNMTQKVTLNQEDIEEIKSRLNSDSGLTVVGYEMYEREGSLKNLQEYLEKELDIKIQMPQIVKLDTPYVFRTKEAYCGKTFWYNEQILPVILIKKEEAAGRSTS